MKILLIFFYLFMALRASASIIDSSVPLGQATMVNSVPVTMASDQSGVPVTGTFWQSVQPVSGTFWQTTQPVSGTFWQATQPVSIATMPSTPVTGTFWQSTQPISAASLPLPTGASTSALQGTGNTSLGSIDTKIPALGQALAASSVPVVLTALQLTALTPLTTVGVTQTTNPWASNISQLNGVTPLMGNGVSGTGSLRVNIASDNTPFPININQVIDKSGTGSITTACPTQSSCPAGSTVTFSNGGNSSVMVNILGTWVGTLAVEGTVDNVTWFGIEGAREDDLSKSKVTFFGNNLSFGVGTGGFLQIRVRASAFTSGTVTVNWNASAAINQIHIPIFARISDTVGHVLPSGDVVSRGIFVRAGDGTNVESVKAASTAAVATDTALVTALSPNTPLPAGTNVLGQITANQGGAPWSDNITQFGGANLSTGTGASGAGIPRVTVSNDSVVITQPQIFTYRHIAGAATTVVKSGSGTLRSVVLNTASGTASVTIYDNTAGSGTIIAGISNGGQGGNFEYNLNFTTGLTIVTTLSSTDITVIYQ